ncbi:MAG: FadR/GntR family transcriptional regulator [Sandaracinaceae bacterium]
MSEGNARKADRVAHDLLTRIVGGEIAVGAVLPREPELAQRYGVNRSVVREAIKLLEVHRLVRPVRRRGTEVLDPIRSVSPEVLRAMIVPSHGRVDREAFADFLELRSALDLQMSMLAAERRTDEDLATLERHIEVLASLVHDRVAYFDAVDRLTLDLARATHNRIFEMLVWWNQEVSRELQDVFRAVRPANEPHLTGVRLLVDLIRRREREPIRALVTAYHEWSNPRLMAGALLSSGEPLESLLENTR